jgi:hypothetical protein
MTDPFKEYVSRSVKSLINHFMDMGVPYEDIVLTMDEELDLFEIIWLGKNEQDDAGK